MTSNSDNMIGYKREEIYSGVFVEKYRMHENRNHYFVFKAEVKQFQTVTISVILTKSRNVELEGLTGLVAKKVVQPFVKTTICKAKLKKGWQLKPKFSVIFSLPSIELQRKYMSSIWEKFDVKLKNDGEFFDQYNLKDATLGELLLFFKKHEKRMFYDLQFIPKNHSIGFTEAEIIEKWGCLIHWRDPIFFTFNSKQLDEGKKLEHVVGKIKQNDLEPGKMINQSLLTVLILLSEMPQVLLRLFLQKEFNKGKLIRVKLLRSGVWEKVVLDTLVPCYPLGKPILLRNKSSAIWAAILEKAYAKLMKSYYNSNNQSLLNLLVDFTGLPVESIANHSFISNFSRDE
jgi:hypothetical protein